MILIVVVVGNRHSVNICEWMNEWILNLPSLARKMENWKKKRGKNRLVKVYRFGKIIHQ